MQISTIAGTLAASRIRPPATGRSRFALYDDLATFGEFQVADGAGALRLCRFSGGSTFQYRRVMRMRVSAEGALGPRCESGRMVGRETQSCVAGAATYGACRERGGFSGSMMDLNNHTLSWRA